MTKKGGKFNSWRWYPLHPTLVRVSRAPRNLRQNHSSLQTMNILCLRVRWPPPVSRELYFYGFALAFAPRGCRAHDYRIKCDWRCGLRHDIYVAQHSSSLGLQYEPGTHRSLSPFGGNDSFCWGFDALFSHGRECMDGTKQRTMMRGGGHRHNTHTQVPSTQHCMAFPEIKNFLCISSSLGEKFAVT